MDRTPLPPPTAELIAAEAAAYCGRTLAPARAEIIAGEVGRMVCAADRAATGLCFEDEPLHFLKALRTSAR